MTSGDWSLSRSRWRFGMRLLAICAALLASFLSRPVFAWQWLLLVGCWGAFFGEIYSAQRRSVEGLSMRGGQWFLLSCGELLPARLTRYHFFGARLGVLTFKPSVGGTWRVSILPDSMCRADFRRLKLSLHAQLSSGGVG
jgi:hypothetical protein